MKVKSSIFYSYYFDDNFGNINDYWQYEDLKIDDDSYIYPEILKSIYGKHNAKQFERYKMKSEYLANVELITKFVDEQVSRLAIDNLYCLINKQNKFAFIVVETKMIEYETRASFIKFLKHINKKSKNAEVIVRLSNKSCSIVNSDRVPINTSDLIFDKHNDCFGIHKLEANESFVINYIIDEEYATSLKESKGDFSELNNGLLNFLVNLKNGSKAEFNNIYDLNYKCNESYNLEERCKDIEPDCLLDFSYNGQLYFLNVSQFNVISKDNEFEYLVTNIYKELILLLLIQKAGFVRYEAIEFKDAKNAKEFYDFINGYYFIQPTYKERGIKIYDHYHKLYRIEKIHSHLMQEISIIASYRNAEKVKNYTFAMLGFTAVMIAFACFELFLQK